MPDQFAGLRETIARFGGDSIAPVNDFARLDTKRAARNGAPEVIFAPGKSMAQIACIARELLAATGSAIVSRATDEQYRALVATFENTSVAVRRRENCRTVVVERASQPRRTPIGHVGILTAGTSDIPAADEALVLVEAMGCRATLVVDVGVAGLHRLLEPLEGLLADGVGALVVAAGMDGALPSVVSGLVPVPVIGLPTSVGYGAGGGGVAALLAMLQTCAPGLAVVNIDNGVGAGIVAARIAMAAGLGDPDGNGRSRIS